MLMGMLYQNSQALACLCKCGLCVLHIGVGFGVARFDFQGDARASMRGTSDRYRFPRFFILNTHLEAVVGNRARQWIKIMKKFFVSLVMLLSLSAANVFAQSSLIATLSHEGEITAFYGADALKEAHEAAAHGDAITLSSGTFVATDITKAVTLRGAGMQLDTVNNVLPTTIIGDFTIQIADTVTKKLTVEGIYHNHQITVKGHLEGARFIKNRFKKFAVHSGSISTGEIVNSSFLHCKITESFNMCSNCDVLLNNCYVCDLSSETITSSVQFLYSVVQDKTGYMNRNYNIVLYNCIFIGINSVYDIDYLSSSCVAYNCVAMNCSNNNFFRNIPNTTNQMSTFQAVFKDFTGTYYDNTTFELTDEAKGKFLGIDGTQVGIFGGNFPFDPTTSNPHITKCNVAAKSTADGKLSVDIEVNGAE